MATKWVVEVGVPLPPIEEFLKMTRKEQDEVLKRKPISIQRDFEDFVREEGQAGVRSSKEHKDTGHGTNGVRQDEKRPDNKVRNERS